MSYIGNQPFNASFLVDTFSGNGSTTAFTMQIAPAGSNSLFVIISGVVQSPLTYAVVGTSLNFTQAPPTGSNNIVVRYLALPASNVTTSAYRNYSEFTATAGQTVFSPSSYTPGFIDVYRNGVKLNNSSFTAQTGSVVILGTAANAGDSVVVISFYISSVLNAIPNTAGAVGVGNYDVSGQGGTGALQLPTGSTAQRPSVPSAGMLRMSSTNVAPEWYDTDSASWITISKPYKIDYLVVAGGGGGGGAEATNGFGGGAGGGGAGGMVTATTYISQGQSFAVVVGGGGGGGSSVGNVPSPSSTSGSPGNSSSLLGSGISVTAIYGGFGAQDEATTGGSGGSGGGTGGDSSGTSSGTSGQGNAGATNQASRCGGGGGGAGAAATSRNGGAGLTWFNGSTYAGGGGGGAGGAVTSGSTGGSGGGGNGAGTTGNSSANQGDGGNTAGTPFTGGGGGGDAASRNAGGKSGGSGVVIIRYAGTQRASGGTVSFSAGYTYHTFTTSGTFGG